MVFVYAVIFSAMVLIPWNSNAQDTMLIVRGDDLGMTQGSIEAFEKAFKKGVLTCASLIVCAPWFEGAADLCRRNPSWCIGVHLSLIGEWRGYRWRPVLPWDKATSLVDEDGFFYGYPEELWAHKPKNDEIEAEFRAQVALALKRGLNICYLDSHYLSHSNYPRITEIIRRIATDYNLPISGNLGERYVRGIYKAPVEQKTSLAVKILEELKAGLWLWVTHPGIDSSEQNALVHAKPEDVFTDGGVGKHRAAEMNAITSDEVKDVIKKKRIKLTTYRELWDEGLRKSEYAK